MPFVVPLEWIFVSPSQLSLEHLFFAITGPKRTRLSNETDNDNDTGSESSPSSPTTCLKANPFSLPSQLSPIQRGTASSPESDLDVDSALENATPENLSLKKEDSTSPPPSGPPCSLDNLHALRSFTGSQGFIPYHHHHHQQQFVPQDTLDGGSALSSQSRSPVNVLLRVFPNRRRSEVEQLLHRFRGDVVQAMEAMLNGENALNSIWWVHLIFHITYMLVHTWSRARDDISQIDCPCGNRLIWNLFRINECLARR